MLDGTDHRVVDELLSAGRLPVLADLRRRSARVEADTIGGVFEEGVWPTVFSGVGLGTHGSQHFTRFDPSDHGLVLRREPDALEPFWLHLPGRGTGVLAVDVPQIHPHPDSGAEEICCWSAWSAPHRPVAVPPTLLDELGRAHVQSFHEFDALPTLDDERRFSRQMSIAARQRLTRLAPIVARRSVACIGVQELHGAAHVLGHHWLESHPHRPWPREPELVGAVYESADAALAPFVADPEVNVVVIAAQGFAPANSSNPVLDGLLQRAGLSVPADDGLSGATGAAARRRLDPMALVRRWISPARRERLATRFLPESVQERLMAQKFRDSLDWGRTRAFVVPSWTSGYLRVNLQGRERWGIVAPDEYDALLDELGALLEGLRDADSGARMVKRVIRTRQTFTGPRADELPDLVVEWLQDRPIRRVSHPLIGRWEADSDYHRYRWCDHHGRAVAYLAGPGIRPTDETYQVDIAGAAATFLRLAGVRSPSSLAVGPWDQVLR